MRLSVFIKIFIILILLMVITISVASPATIEKGHKGSRNVILKEACGVVAYNIKTELVYVPISI